MNTPPGPVKDAIFKRTGFDRLGRAGKMVLDMLYPPVCLHCATPVVTADALCAQCWSRLRPISAPRCPVLGLPFEVSLGPEVLSAEAIADPPPFDRARSAFLYDDICRSVISRLKFGDKPELARFCAQTMRANCAELFEGDPVLVPVPLHRMRHWQRRFNQSGEMCRELSKLTGLRTELFLAQRQRPTRQQVGLNTSQRARNVAGAFAVRPEIAATLGGRRVLIVDDVITTGATAKALTRALQRAGINQIDVISFARVVIGADMPI